MSEKSNNSKINVFAILGMICFAIALVLFAMNKPLFAIIFFTAASLIPVLSLMGKGATDKMDVEGKVHNDEMGNEMIDALTKRLDEAKAENADLKNRIEELDKQKGLMQIAAEDENGNPIVAENMKAEYASILPKLEGEGAERQTVDITKSIKEAAMEFFSLASDAGVDIRIVDPPQPMYVNAAPLMLKTMFKDIIDNAVKYMKKSGTLQVTVANLDDDIFIAMKDNGEGLSEAETVHIFELNYQGSNRVSGNGLGLAQVKAIVDYYGGMIYAKSAPGTGMGIYLHLPAERK